MKTKLLLLGSLALLCRGECVQVGPPQFGRIEVSAFSLLGERLPTLGLDLRENWTGKNVSNVLKGRVAEKLPYGTYTLRISAPGFRTVQREVRLMEPEVQVRAQLSVSVECGSLQEIRGVVTSPKRGTELWIKLVPVRGTGGTEVRVSGNGSFLASGLEDGQYLLLVVEGSTILHTQNVEVPARTPVSIALRQ